MWCCARSLLRSCGVISHTRAPPTCLEICCVFSVLYAKLFTVGECMCFEPCTPGAAIPFIIQWSMRRNGPVADRGFATCVSSADWGRGGTSRAPRYARAHTLVTARRISRWLI